MSVRIYKGKAFISALFFSVLLFLLPAFFFSASSEKSQTESAPALSSALFTITGSVPPSVLSNPLPQGYRVRDLNGNLFFLTPEQLILQLMGKETLPEGWEKSEMQTTAVFMKMIGLHSEALGKISDRIQGLSGETLGETFWLEGNFSQEKASENTPLFQAARAAAAYFLSSDGKLVRKSGELSLKEITELLEKGNSPQEVWQQLLGTEIALEKAAKPGENADDTVL